jgi:nicotinate-nucleotide adenylyltransferase
VACVAIYGGSFNPPHVAHAMVAAWLRWSGRADEVWLLPVYRHAFEGQHQKRLAPFELRLRWTEAMARDVGEGVRVCAIEAELPVPSYTIDTLRTLAARHPEHRFRLVVGSDVLQQLPLWRSWTEIDRHFAPIVVGRQGHPGGAGVEAVDFPAISSTELRRRLLSGEEAGVWLCRSVAAEIDPALAAQLWGAP